MKNVEMEDEEQSFLLWNIIQSKASYRKSEVEPV